MGWRSERGCWKGCRWGREARLGWAGLSTRPEQAAGGRGGKGLVEQLGKGVAEGVCPEAGRGTGAGEPQLA